MSYLVTAACVLAKDQAGNVRYFYEGDVIPWLSDQQAEHFLGEDLVEETDKGVGGSEPVDEDDAPPAEGDKPAEDATKADLVAWVSANVVKDDGSDYSEAELNRMNKDQLWKLINAVDGEG